MAVVPDEPAAAPTAARAGGAPGGKPLGELIAGRYELHEILGRGGVGVVYRAVDRELGETLALKLLAGPSSSDPQEVERFKREIITARRITHPNVIRIHEFGMSGAEAFISMELLPGGTLADVIEKEQPIALRRAAEIAIGVCEGLEAAHAQGIVHRDLKPDNVLFDAGGNPKLVDFGLARLATSTTKTVGFSGTPFYMSPEQADGSDVTARSDLYSLGVLLYELFTGKLPFVADSLVRIALLHANEAPPPPRSVRKDLPAEIEALLLRALQKDPVRRFARAADIAEDLRLWRDGRAMKHTVVTEVTIPRQPAHEETAAVRPTRQPTLKASQRDIRITEVGPAAPAPRSQDDESTVIGSGPPPVTPVAPSDARTAASSRGANAPPPRRPSIPEPRNAPLSPFAAADAAFEIPPAAPDGKKSRGVLPLVASIVAVGVFAAGIYGATQFSGWGGSPPLGGATPTVSSTAPTPLVVFTPAGAKVTATLPVEAGTPELRAAATPRQAPTRAVARIAAVPTPRPAVRTGSATGNFIPYSDVALSVFVDGSETKYGETGDWKPEHPLGIGPHTLVFKKKHLGKLVTVGEVSVDIRPDVTRICDVKTQPVFQVSWRQ